MASSFSSTSITNPPFSGGPSPSPSPPRPLNKLSFPQTSHLSVSKRSNRPRPKLTTTTSSKSENDRTQNDHHHNGVVFDRRNMLLTLGGAAIIGGPSPSLALPVAPDVDRDCKPTNNPSPPGSVGLDYCCLELKGKHVKNFNLDDYPTVMKTRKAAHKVEWDSEFHRDFKLAIDKMSKLDKTDPRSLYMQSLVHCAYCDAVYMQQGHPNKRFMIHDSWLFYPFHRWELYFFERIAGSLIGKRDFALPFWAWDIPQGMSIPDIYEKDRISSLYHKKRHDQRRSGIVDLSFKGKDRGKSDNELVKENLTAMYKQMVEQANSETFLGSKYKDGDDRTPGGGSIENGAHTSVHVWTGGDMGKFSTSGRDPLFYALHGNVDRMWDLWDKLKTRKSRYTDDNDFLNASFIFFDEKCEPVRVYVKDCLDIKKLGYEYEDMPMPWLHHNEVDQGPGRRKRLVMKATPTAVYVASPLVGYPLGRVVRTEVKRPRKSIRKEEEEEVIVVDMELSNTKDPSISFDVYINDEDEEYEYDDEYDEWEEEEIGCEKSSSNYVGSFSSLPMNHKMKTSVKLALNSVIQKIGAQNDDTLKVKLVPRSGDDAIVINGMQIDYLRD